MGLSESEFKNGVKLINGYLKKLDSRISPLSEKMMDDMPTASTDLSYANIRTEVAVVKPKVLGHVHGGKSPAIEKTEITSDIQAMRR